MLKKQYLKSKPACKVTFSLPTTAVQNANEVKLLGDFNGWSWENGIPMKASKEEYKAVLELEAGKAYQFRYLIDKAVWENDYQADAYVPSPYDGIDNSVVIVDEVAAPASVAQTAAPKAAKTAKAAPAKKKAAAKPVVVQQSAEPDDLRKIEGIGPKIAELFADAGITTFKALATAKKSKLKEVLEAAGPRYKMHDPTTWTEQAKLADAGQWAQLEKLQKELKGGKRK